ncbi:MAG: protease inhibitor I42 family protein [Thermoleophilia bacterium]
MKKLLILFILSLAVAGCGDDTLTSPTSASSSTSSSAKTSTGTVKITEAITGQTVKLDAGSTLEVTLKSNVTTGYHWEVASVDAARLQQSGPPVYIADPNIEQRVGSGGTTTFTFKAVKPGDSELKLNYMSPANEQSATVFSITVQAG